MNKKKGLCTLFGLLVLFLFSCATTGSQLSDFFFLHGGNLEEGPMGYVFTSPGGNAMALRPVGPYSEEMVCEFTLQAYEQRDTMNGFLLLVDRGDPGGTIVAGVRIGAKEYVIEGTGVRERIAVPVDFDQMGIFHLTVMVNLKERFVEMKTKEREIGTGLSPGIKQIDVVGYHADSTKTHFSDVKITGK